MCKFQAPVEHYKSKVQCIKLMDISIHSMEIALIMIIKVPVDCSGINEHQPASALFYSTTFLRIVTVSQIYFIFHFCLFISDQSS